MSSEHTNENPIVACIVSLGCVKNLVDTEVICGELGARGIVLCTDPEDADVYIINTCGFIKSAREEAYGAIAEALKWKKAGRKAGYDRRIVVAGCLPQRFPEECAAKYPFVDCFIGIDEVPKAADIICALFEELPQEEKKCHARIMVGSRKPTYLYDHTTPRLQVTPASYAYVKIAEGCNHRCAFCAIPDIRGNMRSRSIDSVVEECRQLLSAGVRELNLIAQDTTAYGRDLPEKPTLAKLLQRIDDLPGEFWIRVLYTHPLHLTNDFIDFLATGKHAVPYLDVPLQHISDNILRAMRRGMTGETTRVLLQQIRKKYPQMIIRTTVMTGFPGETDENFKQLSDFISAFQFDRLGAFAYSPETGTPAAAITHGLVPADVAEKRQNAIMRLQKRISAKRNAALIGQCMTVLIEERYDKRYYLARSAGDAPDVDQNVLVRIPSGKPLPKLNSFAMVKITAAMEYQLNAVLV